MTVQDPVEVAPDGALAELAQDPSSRKRFLTMMGGAGAAGAFSILVAACGGSDDKAAAPAAAEKKPKAKTAGDLAIVNYALTLGYIEADFYAKVAKSGLFKGAQLGLIKRFGANEAAHVQTLKAAAQRLGTAATKPKTEFPLKDAPERRLRQAGLHGGGSAGREAVHRRLGLRKECETWLTRTWLLPSSRASRSRT